MSNIPGGSTGPQGIQGEQGVQGEIGPTGPQGIEGPMGPIGTLKGTFPSLEDLQAAHPTGSQGDAYYVNPDVYVWDDENGVWDNVGTIAGPQGIQAKPVYPKISLAAEKKIAPYRRYKKCLIL